MKNEREVWIVKGGRNEERKGGMENDHRKHCRMK